MKLMQESILDVRAEELLSKLPIKGILEPSPDGQLWEIRLLYSEERRCYRMEANVVGHYCNTLMYYFHKEDDLDMILQSLAFLGGIEDES